MRVKQLKEQLKMLPDDYSVFIESEKGGLCLVDSISEDVKVALNANRSIDYIAPHELVVDDDKLDTTYPDNIVVDGVVLKYE